MIGTPVCFEVDGLVAFHSMQVYRDNSLGEGISRRLRRTQSGRDQGIEPIADGGRPGPSGPHPFEEVCHSYLRTVLPEE